MNLLITLPLPGATITQAMLNEGRNVRGIFPSDVLAFHAIDGFAESFGGSLPYIPTAFPNPKRWSDTGTPGRYLTVSGFLDAWDKATWSSFSMEVYGRTIAQFYQDYAAAKDETLRWIPRFVEITLPPNASVRDMNFLPDVGRVAGPRTVEIGETPYPLAKAADTVTGWTWPTNHAMRKNPKTGLVEAFDYQAYIAAFPIKVTVSTGESASGKAQVKPGQASAFLGAAAQAFFAGNHDAAAADVIAKYVEVK
jgi:hypothetical protein